MSETSTIEEQIKEIEEIEDEEQLIKGEYHKDGNMDQQAINFADKWFPNSEQWQGKTNISPSQAKHLALLRNFSLLFPELEPLDDFLNNVIDDYEMYLTSIDGMSRQQQTQILKAAFGDSSEIEEETRSMAMAAMSQHFTDNDE